MSILDWMDLALCAQVGGDGFFPEIGQGGDTVRSGVSVHEAKRVCMACDVRVQCLDYALANDERYGIWGGLAERERRKLKRERAS